MNIESSATPSCDQLIPPYTNNYSAIQADKESYQGSFAIPVSVVIPFFQGLPLLTRTLASLRQQTYPSSLLEVVVVNDGGDELVDSVVREFSSWLNLVYINQERQGHRVSTARNRGIEAASGEIIISLDFDMITAPDFVEQHAMWFHVSDHIATLGPRKFIVADGISMHDILYNFERIVKLPSIKSVSNRLFDRDVRLSLFDTFPDLKFPGNYFYACNIAYKREHALAIGGFDESYNSNPNYEDIDFGHRLWMSGIFIAGEMRALAYHQENTVVTLHQRLQGGSINRQRLYDKFPELRRYRESIGQQ